MVLADVILSCFSPQEAAQRNQDLRMRALWKTLPRQSAPKDALAVSLR